jgi:hypothetical protein
VLFIISDNFGNVLVDDSSGLKLLNIGALPDGKLGCPVGPRSNSSQQYVISSPFGSAAEPVSENGVLFGI